MIGAEIAATACAIWAAGPGRQPNGPHGSRFAAFATTLAQRQYGPIRHGDVSSGPIMQSASIFRAVSWIIGIIHETALIARRTTM